MDPHENSDPTMRMRDCVEFAKVRSLASDVNVELDIACFKEMVEQTPFQYLHDSRLYSGLAKCGRSSHSRRWQSVCGGKVLRKFFEGPHVLFWSEALY